MCHQRYGLDAGRHRALGGCGRQWRLSRRALQIRIDDNLPVVAEVYRLELLELLSPFLHMGNIYFVALQVVTGSKMHQNFALAVVGEHLHIIRI